MPDGGSRRPASFQLPDLSVHPPPSYVAATPRVAAIVAFLGLLVVSALVAVPAQHADVCLSADGKTDLCYCEALGDGLIRQPVNAISGLAFPLAGLAMLWRAPRVEPGARARFRRDKRIHVAWALCCILLGPASVVYHATFLALPGLFDDIAMIFWMSLFAAYHTGRAFEWRGARIFGMFAAMATALFGAAGIALVVAPEVNGPHHVTELAAGVAILSPALTYLRHGFPGWKSEAWLAAAIGTFAFAFFTFVRSSTGGPWCLPGSWLQGHAVWHVLSVMSIWLAFEHARRTSP